MKKKLGFIGVGNMATAIIKGIISSKLLPSDELMIFDINTSASEKIASEYGVLVSGSSNEIAEQCETVMLCIKPNVFPSLLREISDTVNKNKPLIISIAAGKTIESIEKFFTCDIPVVRVMPNVNAMVLEAMCAYCINKSVMKKQADFTKEILSCIGEYVELDEELFSAFIGISGSAPAFVYLFLDAAARAGVRQGLYRDNAFKIALEAVIDTTKELDEQTIKGINEKISNKIKSCPSLTDIKFGEFDKAVENAVQKTLEKDKLMQQQ